MQGAGHYHFVITNRGSGVPEGLAQAFYCQDPLCPFGPLVDLFNINTIGELER
jgi:hypothetical protein